jgi:predicted XRE-type DNA-binding protein
MNKQNESVWDVLYENPDESNDQKKRSDYLILIQARLYGQSGTEADKAKQFGFSVDQVRDLMNGKINNFSLPELIAIARKIGISTRI